MKLALGGLAVLIIGIIGFMAWSPADAPTTTTNEQDVMMADESGSDTMSDTMMDNERSVPAEGEYMVQAENSIVNWAGQKPLIDGYVNSGSIAVTSGAISVDTNVTGNFTIDMNTLSVSATPAKPGKESALESHLMGERWFDVATYPEASFVITSVTPQASSETTHTYDVTGELTMKDVTDTLTFPAVIYQDDEGMVHASADFEFDRTKWGITAGSGSFFDDLADNVVDDMVALSFDLVAEPQ